MIVLGFMIMTAVSIGVPRQSQKYRLYLLLFGAYLIGCTIFLLHGVIQGFLINFGDEFTRRVYVWDPKSKTYTEVIDDGTYVFKDG